MTQKERERMYKAGMNLFYATGSPWAIMLARKPELFVSNDLTTEKDLTL